MCCFQCRCSIINCFLFCFLNKFLIAVLPYQMLQQFNLHVVFVDIEGVSVTAQTLQQTTTFFASFTETNST